MPCFVVHPQEQPLLRVEIEATHEIEAAERVSVLLTKSTKPRRLAVLRLPKDTQPCVIDLTNRTIRFPESQNTFRFSQLKHNGNRLY